MSVIKIFTIIVVLFLFTIILFFAKTPTFKPSIVTTFYPLYFFTSEITGNRYDVVNLTPFGVEPHEYDPSPRDIALIESSPILVTNGGQFEPWINKLLPQLSDVFIIPTSANLIADQDPHVWLSPRNAKIIVQTIALGLASKYPSDQAFFQENANNLINKLDSLDQSFLQGLDQCRLQSFVTSHNAFSYLAADYNLTQIPINGLSPDSEPSMSKLVEISKTINKNNIKYIFMEKLVSPRYSQTIATETGAKILVLDPLEGLSAKDLSDGRDYFTIMMENLNNLKLALECQ